MVGDDLRDFGKRPSALFPWLTDLEVGALAAEVPFLDEWVKRRDKRQRRHSSGRGNAQDGEQGR